MGINWGAAGSSAQAANSFYNASGTTSSAIDIVASGSNVNGIQVAGGMLSVADSGPRLMYLVSIPPFVVEAGVALSWVPIAGSNSANTYIYKAGDTAKKLFNIAPNSYLENGGGASPASVILTLSYRLL